MTPEAGILHYTREFVAGVGLHAITNQWPADKVIVEIEEYVRVAAIGQGMSDYELLPLREAVQGLPEYGQAIRDVAAKAERSQVATAEPKVGTPEWKDIEIVFLSERSVQCIINGEHGPVQNYAEMGFEDQRNNLPNRLWTRLRELADHNGLLPAEVVNARDFASRQRQLQRLGKTLRGHFKIDINPIVPLERTKRGTGYWTGHRTLFKIRTNRSTDF